VSRIACTHVLFVWLNGEKAPACYACYNLSGIVRGHTPHTTRARTVTQEGTAAAHAGSAQATGTGGGGGGGALFSSSP